PSSIVSAVPPDLDSLVARATALEPDDRFASAAEFLATMRAVRRGLMEGELDRRPVTAPMTMHDTSPPDAGPGVGAAWTLADSGSGQRAEPVLEATAALPMLPEHDVHSAPSSRRARRAQRSRP